MHFAVKLMGIALVTAVSSLILAPTQTSYAASGEEVIKARVNFMEDDIGAHWKVLAAYAKSGKGSLADVEKSAMELAKLAKKIPEHFPKDTGRGKYPDKMTRALPVIWTNWDGFQKDVQAFADRSEKLAELAKKGDQEAVVKIIGKSGSYSRTQVGCAECHKNFRGERVK
jgi:cytochrome c556